MIFLFSRRIERFYQRYGHTPEGLKTRFRTALVPKAQLYFQENDLRILRRPLARHY